MLTFIARFKMKSGREDEFLKLVSRLLLTTYPEEEGVINHIYLKQCDDPSVFVVFEQFRDQRGFDIHREREKKMLGLPSGIKSLVEAFPDLIEDLELKRYEVMEPKKAQTQQG